MSTSGMAAAWTEWEEAFRSATTYSMMSVIATAIFAVLHLCSHLKRYSRPRLQRHVVRIIFMTPIYASCSYLTLRTGHRWPNVLRDVYEAWVIYCFLAILFETLGGEAAIANHVKDGGCPPLPKSCFWGTCCIDPLWSSRISFLKFCRAGTLQFALLKPLCAAAQLLLQSADLYAEGEYLRFDRGFVYIALVYNLSISLSIYALVLFYIAMRDKLAPFRPVRKYVAVKSVIFLSYWQGFLLQLVAPTVRAAEDAQNFLITLEMSVAAVGMAIAFPASQFQSRTPATSDGVPPADAEHPATETGSSSLKDVPEQAVRSFNEMALNLQQAVNLRDVADETRTIFGTGYRDRAMLCEDEVDDFERASFSELANAKGRGGLMSDPVRGADAVGSRTGNDTNSASRLTRGVAGGGSGVVRDLSQLGRRVSALSLGKKKPSSTATAACDIPVGKPVGMSRDSGWEASFDGAGGGDSKSGSRIEEAQAVLKDSRPARGVQADADAKIAGPNVADTVELEGTTTKAARP